MPALDVSEILTDPDFAESLTVIRRDQAVNSHGRAVSLPEEIPITGVVTGGSSAGLRRAAEYGVNTRAIMVHTQFELRDTHRGELPDLIIWKGTRYIVDRVADYSQYGAGFTSADCLSMEQERGC
jgi:galactose-6-phosphate isomerase